MFYSNLNPGMSQMCLCGQEGCTDSYCLPAVPAEIVESPPVTSSPTDFPPEPPADFFPVEKLVARDGESTRAFYEGLSKALWKDELVRLSRLGGNPSQYYRWHGNGNLEWYRNCYGVGSGNLHAKAFCREYANVSSPEPRSGSQVYLAPKLVGIESPMAGTQQPQYVFSSDDLGLGQTHAGGSDPSGSVGQSELNRPSEKPPQISVVTGLSGRRGARFGEIVYDKLSQRFHHWRFCGHPNDGTWNVLPTSVQPFLKHFLSSPPVPGASEGKGLSEVSLNERTYRCDGCGESLSDPGKTYRFGSMNCFFCEVCYWCANNAVKDRLLKGSSQTTPSDPTPDTNVDVPTRTAGLGSNSNVERTAQVKFPWSFDSNQRLFARKLLSEASRAGTLGTVFDPKEEVSAYYSHFNWHPIRAYETVERMEKKGLIELAHTERGWIAYTPAVRGGPAAIRERTGLWRQLGRAAIVLLGLAIGGDLAVRQGPTALAWAKAHLPSGSTPVLASAESP